MSELFSAKELFQIRPEVVTNVDIVVALVSLQLKALDVPALNLLWDLSVCIVDVVATDTSEELPFLVLILPFTELPVLSIDKDCDDSRPPALREVCHTVIHIKGDRLAIDASRHSDHLLSGLQRHACVWVLVVVSILEEPLDVCQGHVARHKHRRHDYHWLGHL